MDPKQMDLRWPVAATAMLLVLSGCWRSSPRRVYPNWPDPRAAERAIELYDANQDGLLDAKELERAPGLKAAMQHVDTNRDGKISAAEISARIGAWIDSRLGRMGVSCVVTHNGRPLVEATVKFLPEQFLGGQLQAAEGTTDARGVTRLTTSAEGPSARGVGPGFYRVEITKTGETIPPRYNAETQLGQEVAMDAVGLANGVVTFDLKY
jgi:hypothetical protein